MRLRVTEIRRALTGGEGWRRVGPGSSGKCVARQAKNSGLTGRRGFRPALCLVLAVAAISPISPAETQASTNVVSNPGFEQGGCGDPTPVVCGWGGSISQDPTNPHSGRSSLHLECNPGGCYSYPEYGASISSSSSVCVALGP